MRKLFLLLAVALTLASCGKKVLVDETHQFSNNKWLRFEPEMYSVKVDNTSDGYVITATLRYDTTMITGDILPLMVDFYIDSTELHNFTPNIRLRDRKGALRGSTVGQYCTVSDTLDRYRIYNKKGDYTYRLRHRTNKYEIEGVTSLNLKIERF